MSSMEEKKSTSSAGSSKPRITTQWSTGADSKRDSKPVAQWGKDGEAAAKSREDEPGKTTEVASPFLLLSQVRWLEENLK
jgi:hypothetical protein